MARFPAHPIARMQDGLSAVLGCDADARAEVVGAMMAGGVRERTGFWLQLGLSVGIATMGLVLDSGAIVIAAMLVAPLMSPILSLGMGLAIGSPYLTLRSATRVLLGIGLAVAASSAIVRLLPFHETTAEIVARTTPTALDLATAAFCALAGVYATMRPASDVASTAAGTSIGISLVPPLCVCGYGLGIVDLAIAAGAALLFVTNFAAIVAIGSVAFVALGFNRVDVAQLERQTFERERAWRGIPRLARWLARRFGSRGGIGIRIAMPLALLTVVYLPLRAALDEVTWQVRVRREISRAVEAIVPDALESRIRIDRRAVDVAIVLIGSSRDAEEVHRRLAAEVAGVQGVDPRLAVVAVPDASAFAGLQETLRAAPTIVLSVPTPPAVGHSDEAALDDVLERARELVERHWPQTTLGPLLAVRIDATTESQRVGLVHHGEPIDAALRETLQRAAVAELGSGIEVFDLAIPSGPLLVGDDLADVAVELATLVERSRDVESVWLCVERPATPRRLSRRARADRARLEAVAASHPRVSVRAGLGWRIRFAVGDCDDEAGGAR